MCPYEQVVQWFLRLVRAHGGVGQYALFNLILSALAYNFVFGLVLSGVAVIPHSVYSSPSLDNYNYATCSGNSANSSVNSSNTPSNVGRSEDSSNTLSNVGRSEDSSNTQSNVGRSEDSSNTPSNVGQPPIKLPSVSLITCNPSNVTITYFKANSDFIVILLKFYLITNS